MYINMEWLSTRTDKYMDKRIDMVMDTDMNRNRNSVNILYVDMYYVHVAVYVHK
jgi:hypothetical protein